MHRIVIYGTGVLSELFTKYYMDTDTVKIVAYIDDFSNGYKKDGIEVIPLSQITSYDWDYMVIAINRLDAICDQCVRANIPSSKIIGLSVLNSNEYQKLSEETFCAFKQLYNQQILEKMVKRDLPVPYLNMQYIGNSLFLNQGKLSLNELSGIDTQRYFTLRCLVQEIQQNDVPGNVAELGVYKGDFAKHINALFSSKKLYLFDTFEGFNAQDIALEQEHGLSNGGGFFDDTSVQEVLSKMPHPEKCQIVKGYFPESATGIEDTFSFVSIDADLFQPIYEGLKYFYPRLSSGGYILVHDFNNDYYSGAKKAVSKFSKENHIPYVPVADYNGSAILTK